MTRIRRLLVLGSPAGWAFVLPAVVLVVLFGLVPIIWGLILSFQKAGLISPIANGSGSTTTRGSRTTRRRGRRPSTRSTTRCCSCPSRSCLALFVAHALNRRIALIRFYRLAVFVPVVTSTIATGIMFLWLFDKNFGLANWLLDKVGVGPFGFFEDPNQAMRALVLMTVWGWLGFDTIIYLAALQGVPQELIEAAAIDGASRWSTFWRDHVADARAGHAAAGRVVHDQRAAAVRRGVLRHARAGRSGEPRSSSSTSTGWRSSRVSGVCPSPDTRPRSPTCCSW